MAKRRDSLKPTPSDALPLFQLFPNLLQECPHLPLGHWPTPVQRLNRLERLTGSGPIWIKRDDISAAPYGGNKVRGLEFLLAELESRGVRELLTFGAVGSFHVRTTAALAAPLGIKTTAVLMHQPLSRYVSRNVAASIKAGAGMIPASLPMLLPQFILEWCRMRRRCGRKMAVIAPGGTTTRACLGHVNAGLELAQQVHHGVLAEPTHLFVPLGSLGTAAGLSLGLQLAGMNTQVIGVVVSSRLYATAGRCRRLAARTWRKIQRLSPDDAEVVAVFGNEPTQYNIQVQHAALGRGYGHFTRDGVDAARVLHESQGIVLDGSYSGKCAAAMLAALPKLGREARVLFWLTYSPGDDADELTGEEIAALPPSLRRYFTETQQPLDGELPT